jgi:hypothetical protein
VGADPSLVIARGARAAEDFLLGELRRLHEAARADWRLLAQPARVLVPSRSLRDHLAARLVRELGGAAAGIAIQTLRALAFELLERSGEGARGGQTLVPVLVRRFAAAEPALADALGAFDDGFAVAVATVNDLLDAGLEASNAEAVRDCLAEAPPSATRARAEALVRVAERVVAELDARGLEPRAGFFRRARERLEAVPVLLPSRALFLHGWADVTGVQLDLLEALVRGLGGCVVLDHPPEPADPSEEGPGEPWTERLRLRLGGATRSLPEPPCAPVELEGVAAPGTHAEARAVADRIRALLDCGEPPEAIGVVLREPDAYRHALAAQLERVGVPFSGGVGSIGPPGRRIAALLELLEREGACPVDRWLDAQVRAEGERGGDLRLAFHGIGVGRLRDLARLDLAALLGDRTAYPLPVRRGIQAVASAGAPGEAEGEAADEAGPQADRGALLRRRCVPRRELERALAEASAVLARLAGLRAARRLGDQLGVLRRLLNGLGWRPGTEAAAPVYGALRELEGELGAGLELATEELHGILRSALSPLLRVPIGGRGGGVALLSALEARGRTFSRLFLMGLNRDVFPRIAREDPLLPDALRRALEAVLPDVPVKGRAEHEERYLFAALCGSAPCVTLSWLATSDDGKEQTASPLVEPLLARLSPRAEPPVLAGRAGPRPAFEHAIRAGFARDRPLAEAALASALDSDEVARARLRATAQLDVGAWAEALGPFFGFVGPIGPADPRARELAVTRLEGMSYCAWRTFLERELGLEPPPDALAGLPDATPLLVGSVVHAVLEELVREAGGAVKLPLEEARAREPVRVPWPAKERLEALVREAALAAARDEGVVLPGFARLLERRALPLLERVRALDWTGSGPAVLGAEVTGAIEIARADGTRRRLGFRADRADLGEGGVALVDYKTGKPISDGKQAETRHRHLLGQIAQGRRLQGPAYARAGEGVREGRYLFAKPDAPQESASVAIASDDAAALERFEAAARDLLAAYEAGAFPPILLGPRRAGAARTCGWCEVSEACLQGETGSRRHLAAWLARHDDAPERLPPGPRAAHALLARTLAP